MYIPVTIRYFVSHLEPKVKPYYYLSLEQSNTPKKLISLPMRLRGVMSRRGGVNNYEREGNIDIIWDKNQLCWLTTHEA